jgi:putative phage-type endonuclease
MNTFQKNRLTGIGGSDASAVIGENPYMTNVELWKIKTGRIIQPDISHKEVVKYGNNAEPIVADLFKLNHPEYNLEYNDAGVDREPMRNKDFNFLIANLDGILTDKDGNKGILEIKTHLINPQTYKNWNDKIPTNYFCQVLHYMLVTNYTYAFVYVLFRDEQKKELKIKEYYYDYNDYIEEIDFLKTKEINFWNNHVLKDIQPPQILPKI